MNNDCEAILNENESPKFEVGKSPELDGDDTNWDESCLAEDYFLPPPDEEEEAERWDDLDEQGTEFERGMDSRQGAGKWARPAVKAKKASNIFHEQVSKTR